MVFLKCLACVEWCGAVIPFGLFGIVSSVWLPTLFFLLRTFIMRINMSFLTLEHHNQFSGN